MLRLKSCAFIQVNSDTLLRTAVGGGGSVGGNFGPTSASTAGRDRAKGAPRLENLSSAKTPNDTVCF
jgi:hypothetical protein